MVNDVSDLAVKKPTDTLASTLETTSVLGNDKAKIESKVAEDVSKIKAKRTRKKSRKANTITYAWANNGEEDDDDDDDTTIHTTWVRCNSPQNYAQGSWSSSQYHQYGYPLHPQDIGSISKIKTRKKIIYYGGKGNVYGEKLRKPAIDKDTLWYLLTSKTEDIFTAKNIMGDKQYNQLWSFADPFKLFSGYKYKKGEYVWFTGQAKWMLVAHLDTVQSPADGDDILTNGDETILKGSNGLGADDRAGVFAIISFLENLISPKYAPSVLFTFGEETGLVGASQFVADVETDDNVEFRQAVKACKFIIELDRQGSNDVVRYGDHNLELTEVFEESLDFERAMGSASDISILAPSLGVSAVNLSIGYFNEHMPNESLYIDMLKYNVARLVRFAEEFAPTMHKIKYKDKGDGIANNGDNDVPYTKCQAQKQDNPDIMGKETTIM